MVYKKGKTHLDADAMSRRGDDDDEEAVDDEDFCLATLEDLFEEQQNVEYTYHFLGMDEDREYLMVRLNAEEEEIDRLRTEQMADPIIPEVMEFVRARKKPPKKFPSEWYRRHFKALQEVVRQGCRPPRSASGHP